MNSTRKLGFTLVELLIVIAILAVLAVAVVLVINPVQLVKAARDSTRLSDAAALNSALALYNTDVASGFMGTSSVVYVSIPDSSATCANLGLPTLPSGQYNCVTSSTLRKTDGTGWIPVNFSNITFGNPLPNLPVDPVNTTSTGNYYTYTAGGGWAISAVLESTKQTPTMASDGGQSTASYEVGSSLALTPMSVLTRASAQGGLTVSNASPVTFAMSGYSTATTTVGSSVNLALVANVYGANAQIISTTTLGTFDSPMHIALDAANNRLYWVQSGKLYGMDSGSGSTTFGANATSTVIGSSLYGVGIDSVNNKLYLADSTGGRIWQVDSGGGSTVFGANSISTSTTAVGSFCVPWDVAVDPTNNMLYVADACNARIVRMNSGSGGTTFGANATSSAVGSWRGIAVDAVNKKVYGAVYSTGILMSVDSGSGGTVFGANATTTNPSLCSPIAYSVDNINNKLYIGNSCTGNLVRVDSGGGGTTFGANKITITGSKTGAFGYIYGIAVDNVSSIVYISDYGYWKMQRFSSGFGSSYSTTGAYTSGAVDMGANTTSWGNLSWVSSGSGTITTKARSSATSDFSGATAWGSCTSLSSGQSLYTGNCVTTGHRYIQFQATLSTSGTSVTPSLDSVNIGYTY